MSLDQSGASLPKWPGCAPASLRPVSLLRLTLDLDADGHSDLTSGFRELVAGTELTKRPHGKQPINGSKCIVQ
jgi:hypothetical protein